MFGLRVEGEGYGDQGEGLGYRMKFSGLGIKGERLGNKV